MLHSLSRRWQKAVPCRDALAAETVDVSCAGESPGVAMRLWLPESALICHGSPGIRLENYSGLCLACLCIYMIRTRLSCHMARMTENTEAPKHSPSRDLEQRIHKVLPELLQPWRISSTLLTCEDLY